MRFFALLFLVIVSNAFGATATPTPIATSTSRVGVMVVTTPGAASRIVASIPQSQVANLPASLVVLSRQKVNTIVFFGDSLTRGLCNWDDATLSSIVGKRLNCPTMNLGVIAQTPRHICVRAGVYDVAATISGGVIPGTYLSSVTVTFDTADSPINGFGPPQLNCSIGGVYGNLVKTADSVGVFTREQAGAPVTCATATFHSMGYYPSGCLVNIAMGYNDKSHPASVYADIAAMVAKIQADGGDYIVNGLFVSAASTIGTADYAAVSTINANLSATYGSRYFDALSAIRTGYNPYDAQDVTDYANGIIPTSLRCGSDDLHPNGAGNTVWGSKLADFILSSGLWRISAAHTRTLLTEFSDRSFFAGGNCAKNIQIDYNHANVGIGEESFLTAATGTNSTALGTYTLRETLNPISNTAIGHSAGRTTQGNLNTYVGSDAGSNMVTGDGNVVVGYNAGNDATWSYGNTFLGRDTGTGGASIVHSTAIGNGAVVSTSNTVMLGTDSDYLQKTGIPVYANNAAATAGGLVAGMFYRTGDDPDVVCVVH